MDSGSVVYEAEGSEAYAGKRRTWLLNQRYGGRQYSGIDPPKQNSSCSLTVVCTL